VTWPRRRAGDARTPPASFPRGVPGMAGPGRAGRTGAEIGRLRAPPAECESRPTWSRPVLTCPVTFPGTFT